MSRSTGDAGAGNLSIMGPLSAPHRLAHELIERVTADITSGKLAPGAKLPTEQEMIVATGVSRTVVREAVAALRADGLVETRQGIGAFVADNSKRSFRIASDSAGSLRDVVEVMELRTGIEIEAAGLAAERASAKHVRAIAAAHGAMKEAIARKDGAVDEDFAFHSAIADATGNPQFPKFLQYLGRFIIPRQTIRGASIGADARTLYLQKIQYEHDQILAAIREADVRQARAAMQRHMRNSRNRYRKLAAETGTP